MSVPSVQPYQPYQTAPVNRSAQVADALFAGMAARMSRDPEDQDTKKIVNVGIAGHVAREHGEMINSSRDSSVKRAEKLVALGFNPNGPTVKAELKAQEQIMDVQLEIMRTLPALLA